VETYYNARGVADRLGMTSEWARQLMREGKIPATAVLNGKGLLVDEASLRQFEEQRRQERQG
jgi:predicted site-specific integrase-resolvase